MCSPRNKSSIYLSPSKSIIKSKDETIKNQIALKFIFELSNLAVFESQIEDIKKQLSLTQNFNPRDLTRFYGERLNGQLKF